MKLIRKIKYQYSEIIIIIIIILIPSIFYVPELLTEEQLNSTISSFGIELKIFIWFLAVKFQTLILLLVWYFTSRHWWKNAILIPLIIELFKIISFLNTKVDSFDEIDYIFSMPITIPIVLSIIFLSYRLNYFINSQLTYDELNNEIDIVFEEISSKNENEESLIREFKYLKKESLKYNRAEYLIKLIALRNKFY